MKTFACTVADAELQAQRSQLRNLAKRNREHLPKHKGGSLRQESVGLFKYCQSTHIYVEDHSSDHLTKNTGLTIFLYISDDKVTALFHKFLHPWGRLSFISYSPLCPRNCKEKTHPFTRAFTF